MDGHISHRDVVLGHNIHERFDLRQVLAALEGRCQTSYKRAAVSDACHQETNEASLPATHQLRQTVCIHHRVCHTHLRSTSQSMNEEHASKLL